MTKPCDKLRVTQISDALLTVTQKCVRIKATIRQIFTEVYIMREFIRMLFSENNSDLTIGLFDIWHFLYLAVIIGGAILLSLLFKSKSEKSKTRLIRLFAYLTIGLYVADFFIMPLSDSYSGISVYKLPFNICTIAAVLVPFVEFNPKLSKIKKVVVALSITASMMWMCYPGSALGGQPPFSYIIFQTFMYHGFLFIWGFLNLSFGKIALDFKKIWQELIGILVVLVWADLGNTIYGQENNWFFIESSIFPFLEDSIMPLAVVFSVFSCCAVVHCIYYAVRAILRKIAVRESKRDLSL